MMFAQPLFGLPFSVNGTSTIIKTHIAHTSKTLHNDVNVKMLGNNLTYTRTLQHQEDCLSP
jgi:hypothetical protein